MALSKSPFPEFKQLAPSTWYLDPPKKIHSNGTIQIRAQPDLIILSTWMSAAPKNILKYTNTYRKLYPSSAILCLTNSVADITYRSAKYHQQHLVAAVAVVRDYQQPNPDAKILLHIFSNGGSHHGCHLAKLYRQMYHTSLPVTGMVLDSCPGRGTYGRAIAATSVGLPTLLPLRLLSLFILHLLCIGLWISYHVFGVENVVTRVRREINDPSLFPVGAKRVYLYSKTDKMVGWEDVEENGREARDKGWDVELVRFERSSHVSHIMEDSDKYWVAVESVMGGK